SLDLEYSEIEQQGGDVSRVRDFIYPKPRMVLSYDLNEQVQIRGRIERTVGQLDFGDFVASFVNDDNRSDVISAGNPELEPEKAWEYELTYERQLPNDLGIFSVTALYADISDHLATVPLLVETDQGSEIRTAPGNLEDAYDAEIEFNGSLRLDWLNLPGAVLDLSLEIERNRVTDPFTGEQRPLDESEKYNWTLAYRQDLDWKGFSYGFET
ncbi:MAG: TonB-dependent receptor, partial [Pseudomonadales bacterium]